MRTSRTTYGIQFGFFSHAQPKQLLKWIGSKHRLTPQIVMHMPPYVNRYIEPFVGSGAVLGAIAPANGLAGDLLSPLIDLWKLVQSYPAMVIDYYGESLSEYITDPDNTYKAKRDHYNQQPNPLDLLFISRTCYGGVVRFTKNGTISTPKGPHSPISLEVFSSRLMDWHRRIQGTDFVCADYRTTMEKATFGDVVYCDPPYIYSQSILYGAQNFNIQELWSSVESCVRRGANVLVSIDGKKKSSQDKLFIDIPTGLFKREVLLDTGPSMLKRFQKEGETMDGEQVHDRLLLTW